MRPFLAALVSVVLLSCGTYGSQRLEQDSGKQIYKTYCGACHGVDGKPRFKRYPDLSVTELTLDKRLGIITEGGKLMPAFGRTLTEEQIQAVAVYLDELKEQN